MSGKYDDLCGAFERGETIKEDFRKKFVEIFSCYMDCPKEQIVLDIGEPKISANATQFDAKLKLTLKNARVLEVSNISFIYDISREYNTPRYGISFGDKTEYLNPKGIPQRVFDNIYNDLLSPATIVG